ncbi:MAG: ABC transporter permease [Planctomycetota bacterium]
MTLRAIKPGAPLRSESDDETLHRNWRIVRRQFFKKKIPVLALLVLCFLFCLAVFAPFLAGSRPLILHDGYKLTFPVFTAFTAEDFLWLSGFGIIVLTGIFNALLRRRQRKRDIQAPRKTACICFILLLSAIAICMAACWPERIDRFDYSAYRDGRTAAPLCLMPLVPWSPLEFSLSNPVARPSAQHWLGTDPIGRDLLARIIHGARVSMAVGFVAVLFYVLIGVLVGSVAGYFGRMPDLVLSRVIEVVLCFPVLFTILAVLCFLPPSVFWVMILIGLFRWPKMARLVRGEFLRLKNQDFVLAARALGLSHLRIIMQILPNSLGPVFVAATFGVAEAILLESGLSFLGFGVQPPTPAWGEMLAGGKKYMEQAWWLTVYPGLAIFMAITAFNLVGEGLRDALDPRMKH